MKVEKSANIRYLLFAFIVFASFAVVIGGLYRLQIVNADMYQQDAGSKSEKTLRLTGKRGMITDADSVVLAMSEEIFNVTFQRSMNQNSTADYVRFTDSILETISIIEKYGGEISSKFVIERDPETNAWTFNFGRGISERAWQLRENRWRDNHYLPASNEKYDTAEKCFDHLYNLYDLDNRELDEALALKVMAIYSEMQMNLYNSLPIVIAKDVPYSAVSEITGRKMRLDGIDISNGEKRVFHRWKCQCRPDATWLPR